MSLATAEDWPKFVSGPVPAHADDLLAAASANITDYCGWPIAAAPVVGEEYDGHGGHVLTLFAFNLVSVEEVRVDGVPVTDFRVSRRYGQLQRTSGCWPEGYGRIQVDFTYGYDPVPANLVKLCVEVASRGSTIPLDVQSETVDRLTLRYRDATAVTGFDAMALERYRLGARP